MVNIETSYGGENILRKRREKSFKKCKVEYISMIFIKLFDNYKVAFSFLWGVHQNLNWKVDNYQIICFKLPILDDTI